MISGTWYKWTSKAKPAIFKRHQYEFSFSAFMLDYLLLIIILKFFFCGTEGNSTINSWKRQSWDWFPFSPDDRFVIVMSDDFIDA